MTIFCVNNDTSIDGQIPIQSGYLHLIELKLSSTSTRHPPFIGPMATNTECIAHKFQSFVLNFNNNQGKFSNLRPTAGQLAIIFVGT